MKNPQGIPTRMVAGVSLGTRVRAYNGMLDVLRKGNLGALLVPLVLLIAGAAARASLSRKMVKYTWHGVTLSHPAGWAVTEMPSQPADGASVVLVDLLGPGRIKPRLTVRVAPVPPPAPPEGEAAAADPAGTEGATPPPATSPAAGSSSHLPLYYAMNEEPVQVGAFKGTRIDSAFAFTPKMVPGRKGDIPVVMRAIDLVVMRGDGALSVQVAAPIEEFEAQRPSLEAIMASLSLDPAGAAAPPSEPAVADKAGAGAVTVTGQVVDAQSGLAVPGAIVLFLAPGTSVSDVDDDNLTRVAFTTGMADSTGHFAGNRPLDRAAHYGIMVVADGYRWVGTDDAVAVADDGPTTVDMGSIPLRRR